MGLDMYANAYRPEDLISDTQLRIEQKVDEEGEAYESTVDSVSELAYWRKHPNLHGWRERLYYSKGGTAESFNCVPVALNEQDLDNLEQVVNGNALPETTGFFFGASHPEDKLTDLAFIKQAREVIKDGLVPVYSSWW